MTQIANILALYFVMWWVTFFVVLPIGSRTPDPEDARVAGAERSAPARPRLRRKVLITTVLAAFVVLAIQLVLNSGLTLEDVPLPSPPGV